MLNAIKNNLLHILFAGIVLLSNSCIKGINPKFDGVTCNSKCYILTGLLLDSALNKGIANGEIKFYFKKPGLISITDYLGKVNTDGAGNYRFVMPGVVYQHVSGHFYAEAFKDDLFHDPFYKNRVASFSLDSTNYDIPVVKNLLLFKPATLKLRIIAFTVTGFRFLTVSYGYGIGSNGYVFNGPRSIDTVLTFKTAGDIRTFIKVDAKGNNVDITKYDTIQIPANAIGQVEIRF